MKHSRYVFSLVVPFLVLMLAACGNTAKPGDTYSSPTSTTTTATGTVIHTASATVKGKSVTLLTTTEGMTLYYFTPDTATTSACTTAPCSTTWPALTSKDTPTSSASLSGTLGVQTNANGSQVTYNGHPLYTYSKDTAAGQTNGEGVGGKWFVATADLTTIGSTTVHTASATVKGKSVTLLTNAEGMTLYYFTPDTATTSACTTAPCSTTWPAFISKGNPSSTDTLPGKLGVQTNANGSQVTYNGHPLYTYSKDTAAGQTNGEGVGGKWFVATTDLAAIAGSSATPTPSSSGYGY